MDLIYPVLYQEIQKQRFCPDLRLRFGILKAGAMGRIFQGRSGRLVWIVKFSKQSEDKPPL